jgi:molecular chaperone Hsp33
MTLRATATWEGELVSPRLNDLLGGGRFAITIDPQQGKQSYQGIVDLEGDSVAEVLQNYMTRSEQLDTRLWLAADATHAAGMLLQRLPGDVHGDDEAWNRAKILGGTVTRGELLALPAVEVVRRLYHEEDVRLFESSPVSFRCSCSRERVTDMLRMLGHDEVKSVVLEQGSVEVDCEFCNRHFGFDAVDVEQIFAADVLTPASSARH